MEPKGRSECVRDTAKSLARIASQEKSTTGITNVMGVHQFLRCPPPSLVGCNSGHSLDHFRAVFLVSSRCWRCVGGVGSLVRYSQRHRLLRMEDIRLACCMCSRRHASSKSSALLSARRKHLSTKFAAATRICASLTSIW